MELQNVVASANLNTKLRLEMLLENLNDSEYQPDTFPGLVYRLENPSASFLIFQTGKIVCIGSRSIPKAKKAINTLVGILRKIGISIPKNFRVSIENIVVSDFLGKRIDIDNLVFNLENSEYTPDTFPGVVYRIEDPKASFLIFSSGKIICAGTRTIPTARKAIDILKKRLKEANVI